MSLNTKNFLNNPVGNEVGWGPHSSFITRGVFSIRPTSFRASVFLKKRNQSQKLNALFMSRSSNSPINNNNNPKALNQKKPITFNIGIKGNKRRSFRNLLQEKRDQALRDSLRERNIQRGYLAPKGDKKRTIPVIPPKSIFIILKSKKKVIYDRKFVDYKNRGLLLEYISFDGKILPKRKTGITTKQQRYLTKAIKTARILGLLPFVQKEKNVFR
uniref:Small ribosomal subunit protein bS18c n=1 Tax=Koshicola spirodelophila TaxID=1707787 RepID=A0A167MGP0_9CHLO|nr:ribosomal protein S18 [Koshicola spirodelophila]